MYTEVLKKCFKILFLFGVVTLFTQLFLIEKSNASGIYPNCNPAGGYQVCRNVLDGGYYCMCQTDDRFAGTGRTNWTCGFDASSCYYSYSEGGYYSQGYYQGYYQGTYATPTPVRYTVTGRAWVDTDGDGDRDSEYTNQTNPARVQLEGLSGQNAPYTYTNLTAGSRELRFAAAPGYRRAPNEDGTRDTTVGPSRTYNFLMVRDVYIVFASVGLDSDNDGTADTSYTNSTNPARVNLSGHGGFDNAHSWNNVSPGTYTLQLGLPTGYALGCGDDGNRSVTVGPSKSYNFCIRRNGFNVTANVQVDSDGNGTTDVNYTSTTNPARVNLSGHGGFDNSHTWTNVTTGTYTLQLGLPTGYALGCGDDGNRSVTVGPDKSYTFCIVRSITPTPTPTRTPTPSPTRTPTPVPGSANLISLNLNTAGSTLQINQPINLQGSVRNNGSVAIGASSLARFCIYAGSPNSTEMQACFNSTAERVGSDRTTNPLGAGASQALTTSTSWTRPNVGQYTAYLCADVTNTVPESNNTYADNCTSHTFSLVGSLTPLPTATHTPTPTPINTPTPIPGLPNLVVTSLGTPDTLEVGQPVGLEGTIRNSSSTATGVSSQARFCIYPGGFDTTDRQTCFTSTTGRLGTDITTRALGAGESQLRSSSTTRTFATAGLYTAYLCADVTDAINEGSDTAADNCRDEPLDVAAAPPPPATADISGNIYVETDGVAGITGSDSLYSSGTPIRISYQNLTDGVTVGSIDITNGTYSFPDLPTGRYIISSQIPPGYGINPSPPSFDVNLGLPCQSPPLPPSAVSNDASIDCATTGSISNLNFALISYEPWIQSVSLDNRFDNGFPNKVPSTPACSGFASVTGSSSTPGVIFIGDENSTFSPGRANNQDWVAGGNSYPEIFGSSGALRTSFNTLRATILNSGTPINTLGTSQCGGGDATSCNLQGDTNGVFEVDGNLTLIGGRVNASKAAIILVRGTVNLANVGNNIVVEPGGFLLISSIGDITVDDAVGAAPSCSSTPQLEGIYVTDNNFSIEGNNDCSVGSDLMLTMAGSIVVNAARGSGELVNGRTLCTDNANYPAFKVNERADFLLNAPEYIQSKTTVWREVAP